MLKGYEWWARPRRVNVVVDNPGWMLPWGEALVARLRDAGDEAIMVAQQKDVTIGSVAFYLGCLNITPPEILTRNQRNLVVHASDLPKGRGFSPLTYQIIEGRNCIPVCLLEAADPVDSGPIIYREWIDYEGHELIDELRRKLGEMTVELCRRFMEEHIPPDGMRQQGEATFYRRRRPIDSALDPNQTIAEQFNMLRTVDNDSYPAYFDLNGHRYIVKIEKSHKT